MLARAYEEHQPLLPFPAEPCAPAFKDSALPSLKPTTSTAYSSDPRRLFIDMNSFYASVEQQDHPRFRNRPLIVVTEQSENTSAIAASPQAKILGIKTGTLVRDARAIDPNILVITSRPTRYLEYHRAIVRTLMETFPSVQPLSIDEMACALSEQQQSGDNPRKVATELKQRLFQTLGSLMSCSIGIGPNIFLSKVAAEIKKPDGLVILGPDYPQTLVKLKATDFPGIGDQTGIRLEQRGIKTALDLWNATPIELEAAFGSVLGRNFFSMLRGSLAPDYGSQFLGPQLKRSLGCSHVLAPNLRYANDARRVAVRLAEKVAARLRYHNRYATSVHLQIDLFNADDWESESKTRILSAPTNDTLSILRATCELYDDLIRRNLNVPFRVSLSGRDLTAPENTEENLFESRGSELRALSATIDSINTAMGKDHINFGALFKNRVELPLRISFGPPEITEEEYRNATFTKQSA